MIGDQSALFKSLANAGLSVIPLRRDGSKAMDLPEGQADQYYYHRIAAEVVYSVFWKNRAVGVVGGPVSGWLGIIDIDNRAIYPKWYQRVPTDLIERVPIVWTPRGIHVYFRCRNVSDGCIKLALDRYRKTLIEMKERGGYVVAPGNPLDVHPLRLPYEQIKGPDLAHGVPFIEPGERLELLRASLSFDEGPVRKALEQKAAKLNAPPRQPRLTEPGAGEKPGDHYKRAGSWTELLLKHGYTLDGEWVVRPGNGGGRSARLRTNAAGQTVLVVFSSNCGVLSPILETKATYNIFEAYSLLEHDGDFKAAARALRQEGFGT